MSELIARLRRRAHLQEFRICGEAADALEAAERERDAALRRYLEILEERRRAVREGRGAAREAGSLVLVGS